MKQLVLFVSLAAMYPGSLPAQSFLPRSDHQARLEPAGRIMNGAGQSTDAFQNYWNIMKPGKKPIVSMYYVGLKGIQKHWARPISNELLQLGNSFVIPQIGLYMTVDGTPEKHYEGDVASGSLDSDIAVFLDGLQELALPVYLRIGYEFNGLAWNGYQPQSYQQAFQRITSKIRERDLEVATVWDYSVEGANNFMDFYPGDAFVDWFGINLFSVEHLTHPDTYTFLNLAVSHNKPVMIGESTPRFVGTLDGQTSWNKWFVPYFNLIHSRPEIKMFCYINWDWSQYSQWSNWGDCRLEKNDYVKQQFIQEMESSTYLHSVTETVFRRLLANTDRVAPPAVSQLRNSGGSYPVTLQWNPVTDPSGLAHYGVYKNDVLTGYSLQPGFEDLGVKAGEQLQYTVRAMDRAGNQSPPSNNLLLQIPNPTDKVINGEFDNGTDNWNLDFYSSDAAATLDIDATSKLSGQNSAHVAITKSSGIDWHIQLSQSLNVKRGMNYQISYKARASAGVYLAVAVQSDHAPHAIYLYSGVTLTTTAQSFSATFVGAVDDSAKLEFFVGNMGKSEVWIDAVSVVESRSNVLPYSFVNQGGVSDITSGYPGSTLVGYSRILPDSGKTTPAGVAIFGFRQNGVLVTEAGVPASALVREGRLFAEIAGPVSTGLAIANPNNQSTTIAYYFTDLSGNSYGAGSTSIGAYSQTAVFLNQAPYNGGSSITGTFTFSSTLPVSVVALRGLNNERNEFLLTTLPVAELSPTTGEKVVSHFADGGGWNTQVVLVNPGDETMTGTLNFFSQGNTTSPGQPLSLTVNGQNSSSFPYSIAPKSANRFQTSGAGTSTLAGYIRVIPATNSKTPSGLGVFSYKVGGITIAQAGVPAVPTGAAFRLYVESAGVFGDPGSIQSGIAVANLSPTAVSATCELTNLDGTSTGLTASVNVPASGQIAVFLYQIPGFAALPSTFQGVLRISTPSSTAISVVGLRARFNERGDFLITTTPSVNEDGQATTTESGFPHLADSGGYTTQFILMSGLKGQTSSGQLRFVSQAGQPLYLPLR